MGNVYKNGHLYPGSQFCGQCKGCKIFHWHTVPKDLNISDLTATSTIPSHVATLFFSTTHSYAQFQEPELTTDQHTLLHYTSRNSLPRFAPCCVSLLALLLCSVRSAFLSSSYLCQSSKDKSGRFS